MLAPHVSADARLQGEQTFHAGRVLVTGHGRNFVNAMVSGPSPYQVVIERATERLTVSCTCPSYEADLEVCGHIWAALLTAEARGYSVLTAGKALLALAAVEPWAWDATPAEGDLNAQRELAELLGMPLPRRSEPRSRLQPLSPDPPQQPPLRPSGRPPYQAPAPAPAWREHLASVGEGAPPAHKPIDELRYIFDLLSTAESGGVVLNLQERSRKANGSWGKFRSLKLERDQITTRVASDIDRQILALLSGARHPSGMDTWRRWHYPETVAPRNELPEALLPHLLPLVCGSGRAHLQADPRSEPIPLGWDDGEPWKLWLEVKRDGADSYALTGVLRRGEQRMSLDGPVILLRAGYFFTADRAARLDLSDAFGWVVMLRRQRRVAVPAADADAFLQALLANGAVPPIDLPEELRCKETFEPLLPRLVLLPTAETAAWQPAEVSFRYGGGEAVPGSPGKWIFQSAARTLWQRDPAAERRAVERLRELGFRDSSSAVRHGSARPFQVQRRQVGAALRALLAEGWSVEAKGSRMRVPNRFQLAVRSQQDWFELHGAVEFDEATVPVPRLLAAIRRGDDTIRLADGSLGLLPEEWLRRIAPLAAFGQPSGDHLVFRPAQIGLLEALIAAEPAISGDQLFESARQRMKRFAGVKPAEAPGGFRGELRSYQKIGLGWLHFLRELGFGGCLADDMGLGKTVQVLALLESRRALKRRSRLGPSLAIMPRSLVFNWLDEAARFAPKLKVCNYTGAERDLGSDEFRGSDLVLTTYGTLRRDVAALREVPFDYIVLDEAQAIKNPQSESAKAARLLKGSHRLALTGTPIENHLGDLWSLLEFLNPGITGASSALQAAGAQLHAPSEETRGQLSRALRPFILRRTKEQVATQLPAKSEQTILCTLPSRQRRLYDELRTHYKSALAERMQDKGLGRAKILVLEALLRLRQAACHPGLLDADRRDEPCAKLDFLLPQLAEVIEEGHKALVFSQFTTFLAILRRQLDAQGITHAYLDGRTRDRAERVRQFQQDPGCKLFLISLKAGGLGLNLTAADYVYLLDPWWNPAVEAQAVDRAHRIGQLRHVFAYRVVAKDTVEEKILTLQQNKRQLADAILAADDSFLRRLTREDLDLLLS